MTTEDKYFIRLINNELSAELFIKRSLSRLERFRMTLLYYSIRNKKEWQFIDVKLQIINYLRKIDLLIDPKDLTLNSNLLTIDYAYNCDIEFGSFNCYECEEIANEKNNNLEICYKCFNNFCLNHITFYKYMVICYSCKKIEKDKENQKES